MRVLDIDNRHCLSFADSSKRSPTDICCSSMLAFQQRQQMSIVNRFRSHASAQSSSEYLCWDGLDFKQTMSCINLGVILSMLIMIYCLER